MKKRTRVSTDREDPIVTALHEIRLAMYEEADGDVDRYLEGIRKEIRKPGPRSRKAHGCRPVPRRTTG